MTSRRAYNSFRKMRSGSVGGQSRIATPVSPNSFEKPISVAPVAAGVITGTYSLLADDSNFYSSGLAEDIYWTYITEVGAVPGVIEIQIHPNPLVDNSPYIQIGNGVTIESATATIRWEAADPFNNPYMMRFVFWDTIFNVDGTDDFSFPGDGESTQTITLSAPYTFTNGGFLSVELESMTNPATDSVNPRGSLTVTWSRPA